MNRCRSPRRSRPKDRDFLREAALRTWRYFADHSWAEHHWLVPDNVQENPVAGDASYFAHQSRAVTDRAAGGPRFRVFEPGRDVELRSSESCTRWRKCRATVGISLTGMRPSTRRPLTPQYVSSVDSGNLAASLATLRQGCLLLLKQPILEPGHAGGTSGSRTAAARRSAV